MPFRLFAHIQHFCIISLLILVSKSFGPFSYLLFLYFLLSTPSYSLITRSRGTGKDLIPIKVSALIPVLRRPPQPAISSIHPFLTSLQPFNLSMTILSHEPFHIFLGSFFMICWIGAFFSSPSALVFGGDCGGL
ncbi:hypothetical protein P152DRAFT_139129 [Eremomyces bilateralis CBS 781.70]|uniref:Uncharacterized protein n=1 Tax=Eremomyces bilateralis CBS 781.70 TaxID=1392243 RepID=A0A6G1FVZ2_9PEZI|nr:uncharacterized protein P152DRAFT_139129 [Eremomyces bilateralis CBS 781.70]KAF1810075.1 hypothetical protein P152DRAFT_139129 [Eremomyces bilateralis CBS 781.70]